MRSTATSLVALLSVLIGLTSASASVCGLSCWLAQASSGCESATSQMDMSGMDMGAGMKMGTGDNPARGTDRRGKSPHPMAEQMGMPSALFAKAVMQQSNGHAVPNPMHASVCAHEVCRQLSAASSIARTGKSPPVFSAFAAANVLVVRDTEPHSRQIVFEPPPPLAVSFEHAATPLRI